MLGSTLVLTTPSAEVLTMPLVNQDGFSSEYYLRQALVSYRAQVRHQNTKVSGQSYDRHNITVTKTTFATATVPEFVQINSMTLTNRASDGNVGIMDALLDWGIASSNANLTKLLGWES